jgi:hypothetical protein
LSGGAIHNHRRTHHSRTRFSINDLEFTAGGEVGGGAIWPFFCKIRRKSVKKLVLTPFNIRASLAMGNAQGRRWLGIVSVLELERPRWCFAWAEAYGNDEISQFSQSHQLGVAEQSASCPYLTKPALANSKVSCILTRISPFLCRHQIHRAVTANSRS